jgi:hypothetical protein
MFQTLLNIVNHLSLHFQIFIKLRSKPNLNKANNQIQTTNKIIKTSQ